ncbi:MAG: hypothetical protein L3J71_03490 [Victivallaceae bacterium]|nr:hypothetical protein [Victivallaceae bacterium]
MSNSKIDFKYTGFIRAGGGNTFEERPAQPSDFDKLPGTGDDSYAKKFADSPSTFNLAYPNWQKFADYYIMRRAILTVAGTQTCNGKTFKASQMDRYTKTGKVTPNNMRIPGNYQNDDIPDGKWLNTGMSYTDKGDGRTTVTINYTQKKAWDLIKIQDGEAPSPGGS